MNGTRVSLDGNTFVMPRSNVTVSGLVNTESVTYVVPDSVERVRAGSETDDRNYFIAGDRALGVTFDIPDGVYTAAKLHFIRQNSAAGQTTNVYDQTGDEFKYENGLDHIAQYNGGSQTGLELNSIPEPGEYKLLLAYDESVSANAAGNDYYVPGAHDNNGNRAEDHLPSDASQLPYLELTNKEKYTRIESIDNSNKTFATGHWKNQPSINILNRLLSNDSEGKFYYAGNVGDYVGVELTGKEKIARIGIYLGNSDALQRAAGCEIQGSVDGSIKYTEDHSYESGTNGNNVGSNITFESGVEWVTLFTMPEQSELEIGWNYFDIPGELRDNYRYIRYIRTAENTSSVTEKNALDLVEVEFYECLQEEPTPEPVTAAVKSVTIDDVEYVDELPERGELTAVTVTKADDDDLTGCVIYAAVYSSGKLMGLRLVSIDGFEGREELFEIEPLDVSDGSELKIFVWDTDMTPKTNILNINKDNL